MLVPGLLAVERRRTTSTRAVDLLMAALLGLVTTAFSFSLFMDGLHYIRVQHASHHGLRRAGERPALRARLPRPGAVAWTIAGGALIVAAGILVVLLRPRRARAGAARMSGRAAHGTTRWWPRPSCSIGLSGTLVTWATAPASVAPRPALRHRRPGVLAVVFAAPPPPRRDIARVRHSLAPAAAHGRPRRRVRCCSTSSPSARPAWRSPRSSSSCSRCGSRCSRRVSSAARRSEFGVRGHRSRAGRAGGHPRPGGALGTSVHVSVLGLVAGVVSRLLLRRVRPGR